MNMARRYWRSRTTMVLIGIALLATIHITGVRAEAPFRNPRIVNETSHPVGFRYMWCDPNQKVCTKVMHSTLNPHQGMTYTNQQYPQYGQMKLFLPDGPKFSALGKAKGLTPVRCTYHIYEQNGRLYLKKID
jgi:hypothetical protein